jgi:hypothetical protein
MSYQEEQKFKEKSPASSSNSASEDEADFDYEERWARGGPQGANQTCDICGSSCLVRPVQTDRGVRHLCLRHRISEDCTILAE